MGPHEYHRTLRPLIGTKSFYGLSRVRATFLSTQTHTKWKYSVYLLLRKTVIKLECGRFGTLGFRPSACN